MTGTTEALSGPAAVDRAARSVARPFHVYAVLANTLFQRGVFVLFLQQRGFSAGQVALLQTLLHPVSGLAELPTGVVADRIGGRAAVVTGQVLTAGRLLGQVAFSDYWVFLALFVGQGVDMACVSGSDTVLLYDLLVRRGATEPRSSTATPQHGGRCSGSPRRRSWRLSWCPDSRPRCAHGRAGLRCGNGRLRRGPSAGMSPVAPGALPRGTVDHRDREACRPEDILKQSVPSSALPDGRA
ncbi:hypothetical protein ACFW9F_09285, partial [Streptomyces sp. NPDC059506]